MPWTSDSHFVFWCVFCTGWSQRTWRLRMAASRSWLSSLLCKDGGFCFLFGAFLFSFPPQAATLNKRSFFCPSAPQQQHYFHKRSPAHRSSIRWGNQSEWAVSKNDLNNLAIIFVVNFVVVICYLIFLSSSLQLTHLRLVQIAPPLGRSLASRWLETRPWQMPPICIDCKCIQYRKNIY